MRKHEDEDMTIVDVFNINQELPRGEDDFRDRPSGFMKPIDEEGESDETQEDDFGSDKRNPLLTPADHKSGRNQMKKRAHIMNPV